MTLEAEDITGISGNRRKGLSEGRSSDTRRYIQLRLRRLKEAYYLPNGGNGTSYSDSTSE